VVRGQIESTPQAVKRWAGRFSGRELHVAVEACTGWLFVCRALELAGAIAHLAEPVVTSLGLVYDAVGRNSARSLVRSTTCKPF
jgi:hypothetical protein